MPIVNMSVEPLLRAVNRGAAKGLDLEGLRTAIPRIGTEVEEVAQMRQYACRRCDRTIERTEVQGPPVDCPQCHADFRADAAACELRGENHVIRLNMLAARPDLYDPGGMARCLRGYLGIQTGLIEYPMAAGGLSVVVDERLLLESSYRPFISCAVLRNVALDDEAVKVIMNLQENLHWALGRDRKLASIGAYDLDTLQGGVFRYRAVLPDELRFVPLGLDAGKSDSSLSPREVLERHGTGRKYARLLAGFTHYPLLCDAAGKVLSMPPIINSESTRVTTRTRNLFVDVTGLSPRVVDRALNVMMTGLKELMPEAVLESVAIVQQNRPQRITPALEPGRMVLSVAEAADTIGISLDALQLGELLARMGHAVQASSGPDLATDAAPSSDVTAHSQFLLVRSPAWRNDIMHPIDLIEDAAVAYGFENLPATLVPTFTVGQPRELEEHTGLARRILVGLGFHQVMTLGLTSEPAAFDKLGLARDAELLQQERRRAVRIENPISTDQTICRVSLLPGLLETFAINKQHDLPQCLFEVGDCCRVDPRAETGAREERWVAVAMIGTHVGFADIRAVCDAFTHELGKSLRFEATHHPSYIAGRAAALQGGDGAALGRMGEAHPQVLENYGLRHPVVMMEMSLEGIGAASRH